MFQPADVVVLVVITARWKVVVRHADSSRTRTIIVLSQLIRDMCINQPLLQQPLSDDIVCIYLGHEHTTHPIVVNHDKSINQLINQSISHMSQANQRRINNETMILYNSKRCVNKLF